MCKWTSIGEQIIMSTGPSPSSKVRVVVYYSDIKNDSLQRNLATISHRMLKTPPFIHIGAYSYKLVMYFRYLFKTTSRFSSVSSNTWTDETNGERERGKEGERRGLVEEKGLGSMTARVYEGTITLYTQRRSTSHSGPHQTGGRMAAPRNLRRRYRTGGGWLI